MKHSNTVFHQLLQYLPRSVFQKVVDRHHGDKGVRTLTCWDQLVVMLYSQLSSRKSLRDLTDTFNSQHYAHYHLGTGKISRTTLADANEKRPVEVYRETFFYLLEKARSHLDHGIKNEMVRLIDASVIDLNVEQFRWAKFRSTKGGIKIHTI